MIPKIVYQTWFEKTLPPSFEQIVKHNKKLNPEYEFKLFDNLEMNYFFDNIQYPMIRAAYFRINPKYGAAKADMFRYMIIYLNGGIYLDIKIKCKLPFHKWIHSNENGYVSYWEEKYNEDIFQNEYGELQNWFLIFRPKDPQLLHLLNVISYNIINAPIQDNFGKRSVLMYTGPITYTRILLNHLNKYKLIQSSSYLSYNVNQYTGKLYNHYSQLSEPLFLKNRDSIKKHIYVNYLHFKNSGIYLMKPYTTLAPLDHLIHNCDLFIVILKNDLYMIAISPYILQLSLSKLLKEIKPQNEYKMFYYDSLCIKQGYINDHNQLIYDFVPYIQFH